MGTVDQILLDEQDKSLLDKWTWFINSGGYVHGREYVSYDKKTDKRHFRYHLLHRLITKAPKGTEVDHINGNKLDNRRENLRVCTKTQNQHNRRISRNNTSGYMGVSYDKTHPRKPWKAYLSVNNRKKHLGRFTDKVEAAKAYNEAVLHYRGDFAKLNQIGG